MRRMSEFKVIFDNGRERSYMGDRSSDAGLKAEKDFPGGRIRSIEEYVPLEWDNTEYGRKRRKYLRDFWERNS